MGYYVNPPNQTKESWLHENGVRIPAPSWPPSPGKALVCLVSNGLFTAAGIAYSEQEMGAFNDPWDTRIRVWFEVPKQLLPNVSNIPEEALP